MAFLDQYLALLGLTEPLPQDPLTRLQVLHRAHQQALPFNNIDLLLGRQNTLDADALQKRVLDERLGGYCFELNGAFARLLSELGYDVQSHLARVLVAGGPLEEQPRTHQMLTVKLGAGETWVVDVGFGANSLREPARLQTGQPFHQLDGTLQYRTHAGGWVFEYERRGHWLPLYWFDLNPVFAVDCALAHHYTATHPASPFLGHLMALRLTPTGRITFNNLRMTVQSGEERHETVIDSPALLHTAINEQLHYPLDAADAETLFCKLSACDQTPAG